MEIGLLEYYLIIANVGGFIAYSINTWLYTYTADKQIDTALTIITLLGGSAGILLFMILFDRKAVKENMMSRVFIACVFVIQIVIFLILRGHIGDKITLAFWTYFDQHKFLFLYLVIINFVTFAAFAVDKIAALENRYRIRIVTLLGLAFIGGSLGALIAMYLLRHKTKIDYFTVGIPLIIIMQIVLTFYLMNAA